MAQPDLSQPDLAMPDLVQLPVCGTTGTAFNTGCVYAQPVDDTFTVPMNVNTVTLTLIGGGGGGGLGPCPLACYYPCSGGGSGYYLVQKTVAVNAGDQIAVHVRAGGAGLVAVRRPPPGAGKH